jgi:hypothetical protein
MPSVPPDQLALEIEDIIRTMPGPRDLVANPDKCLPWLGRASAAMVAWDGARAIVHFEPVVRTITSLFAQPGNYDFGPSRRTMLVLLHQAQSDLRLNSTGPLSIGVPAGQVFQYFDELRKLVESAKVDVYFVDPYIDAEFVSRYLPSVSDGTSVRILARERTASLKPALAAFVTQTGRSIEARSAPGFHDRYFFVDHLACYQSGASFKDGAKKALTTLTQITDAFAVVQSTYETLWTQGTPV